MLSDEVLDRVIDKIVERIETGNIYVLKKIGKNIKQIGGLSQTDADRLVQTLKYGGDYDKIVKRLAEITELTEKDIQTMFEEVARSDYKFAKKFYDYRGIKYIPFDENTTLKNEVQAIANITSRRITNMMKPRVLGVGLVNKKTGKIVIKTIKKAYYELLDEAVINVSQGKETFDQAMSRQIKAMGGGGLKVIYKDGYHRRLDSSIRMNLKDSLLELNNEIQSIFAKQYGADGVEISVHEFPAPDHAEVQGKQFNYEQFENFQNDETATSYDGIVFEPEHDGRDRRSISQYNCYHKPFNIVLGVSKPEYNNKELKAIIDRNNKGFEIDGKHYTTYEGLQMQRNLETKIRKQKDIQIMARESGQEDLIRESQQRITQLTQKYREISKEANLPTKADRTRVSGYKRVKV